MADTNNNTAEALTEALQALSICKRAAALLWPNGETDHSWDCVDDLSLIAGWLEEAGYKPAEAPTRVVFRAYPSGDVLALFPELRATHAGDITCYQHIGQHGSADYAACIRQTRPATPDEYAPLAKELTGIGYRLKVSQRRYHKIG